MVSCHAETDIQNTRRQHVQGHNLESEAKLKREDALYTPDHFWLGITVKHNVAASWLSLMLPSLLRTSLLKIL